MSLIRMMVAGLLTLQGLLVAVGAAATLRDPVRAASLYTEADSASASSSSLGFAIALFMAPLQLVVGVLMLHTAYTMIAEFGDVTRRNAAFVLGAFSFMELLFVGVRIRIYAFRGGESPWARMNTSPALGRRGLMTSVVFSALYAMSSFSLWLLP